MRRCSGPKRRSPLARTPMARSSYREASRNSGGARTYRWFHRRQAIASPWLARRGCQPTWGTASPCVSSRRSSTASISGPKGSELGGWDSLTVARTKGWPRAGAPGSLRPSFELIAGARGKKGLEPPAELPQDRCARRRGVPRPVRRPEPPRVPAPPGGAPGRFPRSPPQ
jgi:hypothetical protein